jgi:hypothetical protein
MIANVGLDTFFFLHTDCCGNRLRLPDRQGLRIAVSSLLRRHKRRAGRKSGPRRSPGFHGSDMSFQLNGNGAPTETAAPSQKPFVMGDFSRGELHKTRSVT